MFGIINNHEKELFKKVKEANPNDNTFWRIPNLITPIGVILITLLIYLFFPSKEAISALGFFNILVNGCIPLIAINQISGIGVHIFKFNKGKEEELGLCETIRIRTILFYYVIGILIAGLLFFAYQAINNPFDNFLSIIITIILSSLLLWASSYTSHKIYLLQDSFIEKTFYNGISDKVNHVHGNNWNNG